MKLLSACRNLLILTAVLCLPYLLLPYLHVPSLLSARIGISLLFLVAGLAHFRRPSILIEMLPNWVPCRSLIIYATGLLELLGAVAILIPAYSKVAGWALALFLILILPANIHSAFKRVEFGGHSVGPIYLLLRIPFQLVLIGWICWFSGA